MSNYLNLFKFFHSPTPAMCSRIEGIGTGPMEELDELIQKDLKWLEEQKKMELPIVIDENVPPNKMFSIPEDAQCGTCNLKLSRDFVLKVITQGSLPCPKCLNYINRDYVIRYFAKIENVVEKTNEGFATQRHGSPIFYELLQRMAETHDKKSHDYASNDNPYGNYHFAGQLSVLFAHSPKDAGFIGRIGEKLYRLANLESSGKSPSNESIEDTEIDLCTIMTLWMADRRNRREQMQSMFK